MTPERYAKLSYAVIAYASLADQFVIRFLKPSSAFRVRRTPARHGPDPPRRPMKRQWDVSYICNILWAETIRIPRAEECRPPGGANNRQWRSQDLEVGGTPIVCGTEVPQRGPGAHWWGVRGTKPPPESSQHIADIWLPNHAQFCVFGQTA